MSEKKSSNVPSAKYIDKKGDPPILDKKGGTVVVKHAPPLKVDKKAMKKQGKGGDGKK